MNKPISLLFYSLQDDPCSGWLRAFVVFPPDPCQRDPGVTVCCECGILTKRVIMVTLSDGCKACNEAGTGLPVIFTATVA